MDFSTDCLVFFTIISGKHKDKQGYICGETPKMYYVMLFNNGKRSSSEDKRRFYKTNVTFTVVTNQTWIRRALEDEAALRLKNLEDMPQDIDGVLMRDNQHQEHPRYIDSAASENNRAAREVEIRVLEDMVRSIEDSIIILKSRIENLKRLN